MTAATPTVYFSVPDAFAVVHLGEDPAARVARTAAWTAALSDEQRLHVVLAQELMVERMRAGHVVFAANGLVRVDGDAPRLSFAQFTVSVHPVRLGAGSTLESIAGRLDAPGLRRQVGFLTLAAGRALTVIEDRILTMEATALGPAPSRKHMVRQVQVMLPFPDRRHLAVLALSTECLQDWSVYVDVMGGIVRTVSFVDPAGPEGSDRPTGRIAAALEGMP